MRRSWDDKNWLVKGIAVNAFGEEVTVSASWIPAPSAKDACKVAESRMISWCKGRSLKLSPAKSAEELPRFWIDKVLGI